MPRKNHYMMATKATHKIGDISKDNPSLCLVCDENEENYIGSWVTGLGFIDVQFPKSTTRELTEEEKTYYNEKAVMIGNVPLGRIFTK